MKTIAMLIFMIVVLSSSVAPILSEECLNRVIIYSNGSFKANIEYSSTEYKGLPHDLHMAGVYVEDLLSYNISYRIEKGSGSYESLTIITGDNGLFTGSFSSNTSINNSYLLVRVNYESILRASSVLFKKIYFEVETNNYKELIMWNITFIKALLVIKTYRLSVNTSSYNNLYVLRAILTDTDLSFDQLRNDDVKTVLGLPVELDPMIVFSHGTREIRAYQLIRNRKTIINRIYRVNGIELFKYNGDYVVPLPNSSRYIVLSSTKYVVVEEAKWNITFKNNSLKALLAIKGRGLGVNTKDRIESVINNIRELVKTYGCFKVESKNFYFIINGGRKNVLVFSNETLPSTITIEFLTVNEEEDSFNLSNPLILAPIIGGLVILFVLVLRYYLLRRSIFSRHSQR